MGYYLETDGVHGKAQALALAHQGRIVSEHEAAEAMSDPSRGVVVVVDNGPFEAAAFAFNMREWEEFTRPSDSRPRQFVVMDRKIAEKESGYPV